MRFILTLLIVIVIGFAGSANAITAHELKKIAKKIRMTADDIGCNLQDAQRLYWYAEDRNISVHDIQQVIAKLQEYSGFMQSGKGDIMHHLTIFKKVMGNNVKGLSGIQLLVKYQDGLFKILKNQSRADAINAMNEITPTIQYDPELRAAFLVGPATLKKFLSLKVGYDNGVFDDKTFEDIDSLLDTNTEL